MPSAVSARETPWTQGRLCTSSPIRPAYPHSDGDDGHHRSEVCLRVAHAGRSRASGDFALVGEAVMVVNDTMARSATVNRKTPRRHRAGRDPVATVRLPRNIWGKIDRWQREHGAKTRSEAIQWLVAQALKTHPGRRPSRKFVAKASKLAGRVIDRLTDRSATRAEQAKRKRRLIKGPREFRSARRNIRS